MRASFLQILRKDEGIGILKILGVHNNIRKF